MGEDGGDNAGGAEDGQPTGENDDAEGDEAGEKKPKPAKKQEE